MTDPQEDIVVTKSGQLRGCRGRVLVALIVLAVLILLLFAFLVRGMLTKTQPQPQPARRTATDVLAAADTAFFAKKYVSPFSAPAAS